MQYRVGTVSVENGSPTVTGDVSSWVDNVSTGNLFMVVGDNTSYEIASIGDNTTLTLTSNYGGSTATGRNYAITGSFTPIYGLPYIEPGDIETATIFKRAMLMIEAKLAEIEGP